MINLLDIILKFIQANTKGAFMIITDGQIKEYIKKNEGKRNKPYKDSLGFLTLGYGHLVLPEDNIDPNKTYSDDFINKLFDKDYEKHKKQAKEFPCFDKLDSVRQAVIIDMCFNMGKWFLSWQNTTKMICNSDWENAANSIINSKYAKQVKGRAVRNAEMIRTGIWVG